MVARVTKHARGLRALQLDTATAAVFTKLQYKARIRAMVMRDSGILSPTLAAAGQPNINPLVCEVAAACRDCTSAQFTTFQNALAKSTLTFLYCR